MRAPTFSLLKSTISFSWQMQKQILFIWEDNFIPCIKSHLQLFLGSSQAPVDLSFYSHHLQALGNSRAPGALLPELWQPGQEEARALSAGRPEPARGLLSSAFRPLPVCFLPVHSLPCCSFELLS